MIKASIRVSQGDFSLESAFDLAHEVLVVVGPNGAGKSTLVRALAGLIRSDSEIEFDGRAWENERVFVPPEARDIAMVFNRDLLLPHLTVAGNIALTARDAPEKWMERFDLIELANDKPVQLSAGQRQRAALARSFARRPGLMLMDEPLAAVDVSRTPRLQRLLLDALGELAIPAVIVSHDPAAAATMGDRVAVLEAGRLVQLGPPDELRDHPRSAYVADLVGLNVYTGNASAHRLRLPKTEITSGDQHHGPARATIHPRSVILHREPPQGSPRNVWEGSIVGIDRSFDLVRVVVEGPLRITATVTEDGLAAIDGHMGATVWASVKASEVRMSGL